MDISIQIDSAAVTAAVGRLQGPEVTRLLVRSLEIAANRARTAAVREFTAHSIGRKLFGRRDRGAFKIIQLEPIRAEGDTVTATLKALGLAAIQEQGGRIKPHIIKPRRAKVLAYAQAGAPAFARIVHHPGATMPAHPALVPEAQKIPAEVVAEVQAALEALWAA